MAYRSSLSALPRRLFAEGFERGDGFEIFRPSGGPLHADQCLEIDAQNFGAVKGEPLGMRNERVESAPGKGTTIQVEIPLDNSRERKEPVKKSGKATLACP